MQDLADKKKGITDEDLIALVNDEVQQGEVVWQLVDLQVVCGTMGLPTATVRLVGPDGLEKLASSIGTGPVDAAYKVWRAPLSVALLPGMPMRQCVSAPRMECHL